ncbi:MAG: hypothetical protein ABI548_23430, partial [Polyangiaceae bacterium]
GRAGRGGQVTIPGDALVARILSKLDAPGARAALGLTMPAFVLACVAMPPAPVAVWQWATERLDWGNTPNFAAAVRHAVSSYDSDASPSYMPPMAWAMLEALGHSARVYCRGEAN